jgi:hypothetical protein
MLIAWRSEVPGPVMPGAATGPEHRLGAVARLPILPIPRVRAQEHDPVGAAAQ